jgi:hypothetical protein
MRHAIRCSAGANLLVLLAGCGPNSPKPGTALRPPVVTTSYACARLQSLRVRMNATSVTVTIDGDGPYTLPLVMSRPDLTSFSDGQYVFRIINGETSFGGTRGALQPCTRT